MKKFNVLFIALVLMMSMLFIGCDMFGGEDGGVTVNYIADDGFALQSATVAFDNSSSVSNLNSSSTEDNGRFYVPTDYATLNVATPTISFTFNENLSSDSIKAVFRVDNGSTYTYSNGSILEGIFTKVADASVNTASGTDIACTDVSVSGATVTFSFEEDTFAFDAYYFVEFGVTSAKGEMYKVTTCFQPQTDVNGSPLIESFYTSDFNTDYYSWAVDNDEIYLLAAASDLGHTDDEEAAETIATVSTNAGRDFGTQVDSYFKRFENIDDTYNSIDYTYASLDDMKDELTAVTPTGRGAISTVYKVVLTRQDLDQNNYARGYYYYWENAEGVRDTTATTPSSVSNEIEYDDEGNYTSYSTILSFDISATGHNIVTGDKIVAVPWNSRGQFTDYEVTHPVTDTVRPFHEGVIDNTKASSTLQQTGTFSYVEHDHHGAADEGEIELIDSFVLKTEIDSTWTIEEDHNVSFSGGSLQINGSINMTSGNGSVKTFNRATLATAMDLDVDNCYDLGNNLVGVYDESLAKLDVYIWLTCHSDTADTVSYPTIALNGSLNYTVTDNSGNALIGKVSDTSLTDATDREISNGQFTIFFAE